METSMTQSEMILEYLSAGYKLTPLEALSLFGCLRLGARVWDLKKRGYNIVMQLVEMENGKRVAQYSIPM
jgi:hypothetical protein